MEMLFSNNRQLLDGLAVRQYSRLS